MQSLEAWLSTRGSVLAQALDAQRNAICEDVSRKLAAEYPDLCPNLPSDDPELSQQIMFQQTPQRFHVILLAALRFHTLAVIEREYRWLWVIVQRFGVRRMHLLQQVRWYFEAAQAYTSLSREDRAWLTQLELAIEHMILTITAPSPAAPRSYAGAVAL